MKTRMIALLILVAVIVGSVAAPVFAASYNYNGTFYHLIYASPTFNVTGVTKCSGSQRQLSGTKPTGVRYALVKKAADPALDTVFTWNDIYGNVGYSFEFKSINKSEVRLRFWNLHYEGNSIGKNQVNTAGTFSGKFTM